jgi:tetratricopeptide (TPR) repeat protein
MDIENAANFSDLFKSFLDKKGIGVQKLATLIEKNCNRSVSKSSLQNWYDGRSKSPRDWQDVVAAAVALELTKEQANSLLKAARHPSIDKLWEHAQGSGDLLLLVRWTVSPSEEFDKNMAATKDNTNELLIGQQQLGNKADRIEQAVYKIINEAGQTQSRSSQHEPQPLPRQPDIPYFTGRTDELNRLKQILLAPNDTHMSSIGVQISGTGGMGKSSLAYHFAHTHKKDFKDGVLDLKINDGRAYGLTQYTPAKIARDLLQRIDQPLRDDQSTHAIETMQKVFRQKHILLILDNVENEVTIRGLIPGGNCKVIVTTRNRTLLDEVLPEYAHIDLQGLSSTDTQQLLARPEFIGEKRVTDEREATEELCQEVGGLPLALRLAGSALKHGNKSISSYVRLLKEEKLSLLSTPGKDTSNDPDHSVRASFNVSLQFLTEEQEQLFAYLSACAPEGFSSTLAKCVADQSEFAVSGGLDQLSRLSLIDPVTEEVDRFRFHPLLHTFAHELALKKKLLAAAEQRHTKYFLDCIEQLRKRNHSVQKELQENLDGLLLAARYLPANLSIITNLYLAVEPLLQRRGYWEQALELLERRLEIASKQKDFHEIAQTLLQRGQFLEKLARLEDAEKELKAAHSQALRITDVYSRQSVLGKILNSLGGVYRRMKKFDEAITALQQSYNIRKALGDNQSLAVVLNSLGGVYRRQRRYHEALKAFQESLAIGQEEGMHAHVAEVLNSLGVIHLHLKKPDEAITALQESYNLLVTLGDEMGQAKSLNSLGKAYLQLNKLDEAVEASQKSVAIERKAHIKRGLAIALTTLGDIYRHQGRYTEAIVSLQEALSLEEKLKDFNGQDIVKNLLDRTLREQKSSRQK